MIARVEKTITAVGTRALPTVERMDEAICRLAEAQTACAPLLATWREDTVVATFGKWVVFGWWVDRVWSDLW